MNRTGHPPVIRFTGRETQDQELARLRIETAQLKAHIEHFDAMLAKLKAGPGVSLPCVGRKGDRIFVTNGGPAPLDLYADPAMDVQPGDIVRLHPENNAVLGRSEHVPSVGRLRTVTRLLGEGRAEVDTDGIGGTGIILLGRHRVEPGDRVTLDMTQIAVTGNHGKSPAVRSFDGDTGVSWDDIRGQEEAKRALREAIEEPFQNRELYEAFGKRPASGILLYGPPGCGKTLLGKAAATAIARLHGTSAKATGFIYVAGPELLHHLVGSSESGVRALFAAAEAHEAEHHYPAIIFIDECDALMGRRGGAALGLEGMERTIVPAFLTAMDGLRAQTALVLLATNRPDKLDPAIVRDRRVDVRVDVGRPTQAEATDIARLYLAKLPLDGSQGEPTAGELAAALARDLYAPSRVVGMVRCHHGGDERMTLGDVASGALIHGMAERAAQRAIRRIRAGDSARAVTLADVVGAVEEKYREACGTDHTDDALARVGEGRLKAFEPTRRGGLAP